MHCWERQRRETLKTRQRDLSLSSSQEFLTLATHQTLLGGFKTHTHRHTHTCEHTHVRTIPRDSVIAL